jgi:predicted transcriptional regulator
MMTKIAQIVAALRSGAATSQEIASKVRADRRNVSVTLCRLAALGVIERAGVVNTRRIGRPYVRWRVRR